MKALISLALLFPLVCQASVSAVNPSFKEVVYQCDMYTDNEVDYALPPRERITTDNPMMAAHTEVIRTQYGYTIKANSIFPNEMKLTNPTMELLGGFAGNQTSMVFRKENDNGVPYFLVYLSPDEKSPIDRLVTLGYCASN